MAGRKFRFAIAIVGVIPARNRSQAYMLIQMGFALVGRLLGLQPEIAITIEEIHSDKDEAESSLARLLFEGREGS